MLCVNGFETNDALAKREAQRCLANALLLKPDKRRVFVEVGGLDKFVSSFKAITSKRNADDDFLLGRIGFLLSAQKGEIVERLVNEDRILEDLKKVVTIFRSTDGVGFTILPQEWHQVSFGSKLLHSVNGNTEISLQLDFPCQSWKRIHVTVSPSVLVV